MKSKINALAKKYLSSVIEYRRHIHQNPELGFEEFQTTEFIKQKLAEEIDADFKFALKRTKTGIYFDIDSKKPGKTLLFRADIDALPIQEENNFPYKSKVNGIGHMCGHDGHTASLIGVAKIINQLKDDFVGKVRFLFQPAEEGPDLGGAVEIVEENEVLAGVDCVIGMHIYGAGEFGKIYFKHEAMYSSFIDWDLTIKSAGGHCSEPHKVADPVLIGSHAVVMFQSLITKMKAPLDSAIIATGVFNSGSNANVIPSSAKLSGTIRTYDLELGRLITKKMKSIMEGLKTVYGGDYQIDFLEGYPPLINDEEVTDSLIAISKEYFGSDNVKFIKNPSFGCEDFSYFVNKVKGCYFKVGILKKNEKEPLHHSSTFDWDDSVLLTTMEASVNAIIGYLNKNS